MCEVLRRCPWCMSELEDEGGVCPRCEHDPSSYVAAMHQLPPGTVLNGRYLVGRTLGEGGFGITYIGFDETLRRRVAIKEYFPVGYVSRYALSSLDVTLTVSNNEATFVRGRANFLAEARTMARVGGHEALVGVTDFFPANGTAYIIMDFIEGESLKGYCERLGCPTFDELMEIITPIMDALQVLHEAGLVHRDISPDNIMVTSQGARLIDFGCSREFVSEAGDEKTMTVMLKYDFAAPEQYGRGGQGPWSDVYGMCVTIYWCLTGITPPRALERMSGARLVPPSERGIQLPQHAEEALLHGLEPRATERIQSMSELKEALLGTGAKEKRRPSPLVVAGAIGAFALVLAVILLSSGLTRVDGSAQDAMMRELPSAGVASEKARRIAAGDFNTVLVTDDGHVEATKVRKKKDDQGQCDVEDWNDVVGVASGCYHTVALRSDGTVLAAGWNEFGQCDVDDWKDVTDVACGLNHTVALRSDGTVVASGNNEYGQCDVDDWEDVVAIAAGDGHTVALRSDGTVVAVGFDEQDQCDVGGWSDVVAVSAGMSHTVGVTSDGRVVATEIPRDQQEYDFGQCDVDTWEDVVAVSAGRWHTVALRSDGSVVACGDKENGRCNVSGWNDVEAVAAGANHTVALMADGTLKAVGSSEMGQTAVDGMSVAGA